MMIHTAVLIKQHRSTVNVCITEIIAVARVLQMSWLCTNNSICWIAASLGVSHTLWYVCYIPDGAFFQWHDIHCGLFVSFICYFHTTLCAVRVVDITVFYGTLEIATLVLSFSHDYQRAACRLWGCKNTARSVS